MQAIANIVLILFLRMGDQYVKKAPGLSLSVSYNLSI